MFGLAHFGQQLSQLAPPSALLHTPPAAAPASRRRGSVACATSAVTRPAMLNGPMHSHFFSLGSNQACARSFQKSSSSPEWVSCSVWLARCANHALCRLNVENSSLIISIPWWGGPPVDPRSAADALVGFRVISLKPISLARSGSRGTRADQGGPPHKSPLHAKPFEVPVVAAHPPRQHFAAAQRNIALHQKRHGFPEGLVFVQRPHRLGQARRRKMGESQSKPVVHLLRPAYRIRPRLAEPVPPPHLGSKRQMAAGQPKARRHFV